MKKDYRIYVKDIFDAITKVEEFTKGRDFAKFSEDEMCVNAVIRKLEIMGEAAKSVPLEVKKKHRGIPWAEMAKTRDKVIHAYSGIDNQIIWRIITENLPPLKKELEKILKSE